MVRVGAVILAAGGSTRFGQPKQLIKFAGETLVQRAVRAAQEGGCSPVLMVTGESHEAVSAAVAAMHPHIVRNESWSRGIGSSIRLGVEQLSQHAIDAIILLACDQPAVDMGVVSALIAEHERSGCPIVASRYADTLGIPVLFQRSMFDELRHLPDQHGAKALTQENLWRGAQIEFAYGAFDLDTREDLLTWEHRCEQKSPGTKIMKDWPNELK
jgi:molybdenum cofactor cytidylyltransferase